MGHNDTKKRKIKKLIITRDYEKIRKVYRKVVARSENFDSLKEAAVRAIYDGEWYPHPHNGYRLHNEKEVVLDILEVIAEEAYTILNVIPMRKMVHALSRKMEIKERFQREREVEGDEYHE